MSSLPAGVYKLIGPGGEVVAQVPNPAFQGNAKEPFVLAVHKFSPMGLMQEGSYYWTYTPTAEGLDA